MQSNKEPMEKVRILLIGVGTMGRLHLRRLRVLPEAHIVGLVNPSPSGITLAQKLFPQLAHVPVWSDYRTALREVEADAAIIASPHVWHFEQGMACLDAGMHVLLEKPFVSGSDNAETLARSAVQKQKHLAVAYQQHLEGPFLFMREVIQSGELGPLTFFSAYQAQNWLRSTAGTWRQNPELSCGGQLNDSGSHLLDAMLWLTSLEPTEVSTVLNTRGTPVDVDAVLSVHFRGGAIASLNIVGSASVNWWLDIALHGEKGTLLYRNQKLLLAREGERVPREIPSTAFPASSDPACNFVELILGRVGEAAAPASYGVATACLTEAAYESARQGQAIPFSAS